jgi:hypothetical protein
MRRVKIQMKVKKSEDSIEDKKSEDSIEEKKRVL